MSEQPWQRHGPTPRPVEERLWEKVDQSAGPDACWPWQGALNSRGRAVLQVSGRTVYVTRLLFELRGEPLGPLFACHRCDNPGCVNPAHLFAGTHVDNMSDMSAKGRTSRAPKPAEQRAKASASLRARWAVQLTYEAQKTHCPQGHPYSGPNLLVTRTGHRRCRACISVLNRRARERRKAH